MTAQQVKDFIKAMETAGITSYMFLDGFETVFHHNTNSSLLFPDYSKEVLIEVRATIGGRKGMSDGKPYTIAYVPFDSLAECRVSVNDLKELQSAIGDMGITLDNDQFKQIAKAGFKQSFVVNDYTFTYLTEEDYNKLTDDEKAKYDQEKKQYELRKAGVSQGGVSVNTGGFPLK